MCGAEHNRGFALALVLWLVALLAMMALSLSAMQRTETVAAANLLEGAQARSAAQAGIQLAILDLMKTPAARQMTLDGMPYEVRYRDAVIRINAIDEAGKVDINFATGPLLDELLRAAGVADETQRLQLLDAILDWRDSDELRRMHGAEIEEYKSAGVSHSPRNAPFQSIEELSLVMGMSAPLYHRIAGSITIYTGASGIDRTALAISRLAAPDRLDEEQAAAVDGPPEEDASAKMAVSQGVNAARVVTIRCDAQLPDGVSESLEAVVRFTPRRGNAAMHHEVLLWREVAAVDSRQRSLNFR